ncbi:MAG: hypothetical protein WCP10_07205 [Desulfuromonadales bacterium]
MHLDVTVQGILELSQCRKQSLHGLAGAFLFGIVGQHVLQILRHVVVYRPGVQQAGPAFADHEVDKAMGMVSLRIPGAEGVYSEWIAFFLFPDRTNAMK